MRERVTVYSDHPRIRGEHVGGQIVLLAIVGSSPHTRGAPPQLVDEPPRARIIPAYAGSTSRKPPGLDRCWDHPRIRGEHSTRRSTAGMTAGSSPHTRGALLWCPQPLSGRGIIPAYAGSTFALLNVSRWDQDHPRIRGEHVSRWGLCVVPGGSSPHTRGARDGVSASRAPAGIIPAYAGSTDTRSSARAL